MVIPMITISAMTRPRGTTIARRNDVVALDVDDIIIVGLLIVIVPNELQQTLCGMVSFSGRTGVDVIFGYVDELMTTSAVDPVSQFRERKLYRRTDEY